MGKYKYLLKNMGLLTIANFATKLLQFFLVPLYTNILTTTEYGTYDLFNTTVGVLTPILTLNIQDAVIRFALDKNYKRDAIVSVGTKYIVISNLLVATGLAINSIFGFFPIVKQYAGYFFLMYLTQSLSGFVSSYTRGIDKIADLSVSSVAASAMTIGLNIVFLVTFKWGLSGYFLANAIGPLAQSFYLIIKGKMPNGMHFPKLYKTQQKEMVGYSEPLIANAVAWWVNNVSDRYVVIYFCGLAANGIYSVAGKIPAILNVFQTIFNSAWTLSAVKDFDPEDKDGFFSNTYKAYNCLMTIVCSLVIVSDKILAKILYAKDFYIAWKYVPWLTIAILFGALSGYLGGFFSAVKDSKIFATSTVVGAVSNVILNIVFTPIMGPLGASIATAMCYIEVFGVRYVQSKKYIKLKVNFFRDVLSYLFLVTQSVTILMISNNLILYGTLGVQFVIILLLYINDIKLIVRKILHRS